MTHSQYSPGAWQRLVLIARKLAAAGMILPALFEFDGALAEPGLATRPANNTCRH